MMSGYRTLLQASLVAGAALLGASQAYATGITPEFELIEGNGVYTLVNNSTDEWIYGFTVSNPLASKDADWTTQSGWSATKEYGIVDHRITAIGYTYSAKPFDPPFYTEVVGRGKGTKIEFLPNMSVDIAPGQSSNLFLFGGPDPMGSVTFDLVGDDILSFAPAVTMTPLPTTWLMMLSGLIGCGLLAYRGKKVSSAGLVNA
jgi:hypothetical protein